MQDFSVTNDVSQYITPSENNLFSADVEDETLSMKTDSLCYFRVAQEFNSLTTANVSDNSKGLSYYSINVGKTEKLDEPQTLVNPSDGKSYTVNYKVTASGTNALFLEEVGGVKAIGLHTYNNNDNKAAPVKRSELKFNIKPGIFSKTDNAVTFKFRVYADKVGTPLSIVYLKPNGGQRSVEMFTFSEDEVGKWVTKEYTFEDIDLTALIVQDGGTSTEQKYPFRMNSALGYDIFIHSLEIVKPNRTVTASAQSNTYEVKINDEPLVGDIEFSYDMMLPSEEACVEDICEDGCVTGVTYNTGKNRMQVNLLNNEKVEIATVVYDLNENSAKVGIEYTDENGDTAFDEVYDGNILGRNLRYVLSYNMAEATNTFCIYEGEDLVASTTEPLTIKNKSEDTSAFVQYYNIGQNQSSYAICAKIDNISVKLAESRAYKSLVEDIESIELPTLVRDNFTLPLTGSVNESSIVWESDDTGIIAISGSDAVVTRNPEENKKVVLTATTTDESGIFKVSKDFEITVKALKGEFADTVPVVEQVNGNIVTATTTIMNAGRTGAEKIRFMAVSYVDGEIFDRQTDEKTVTTEYERLDFEVDIQKGDTVKYYLWDENNVPIVNNAPQIYTVKFENKVRGATIKWEKAFDDFDAVENYKIERNDGKVFITDGEECGDNMLSFYDEDAVENTTYTYNLTAVDTNQNVSSSSVGNAKKTRMPYSMDLTKPYPEPGEFDGGNHITFIYRDVPARAAYTEYSQYDGEGCVFIPNGKYAAFKTDVAKENIVVRFTYAATGATKFKFMYNGMKPDGTYAEVSETIKSYPATDGWETVEFKLDKKFGADNLNFSSGAFGIGASAPEGLYIKKVEFVKMEDYE